MLNAVVFLGAWTAGLMLRPFILDIPIWGRLGGEYGVIAASASLTFVVAGAIAHLWSRHWAMVAVPALISFEVGLTLLAMAIYIGDGGSEALMWTYIWPEGRAWLAGSVAASFAVSGYLAVSKLRRAAARESAA
jgi:hypothetical protein